MHPDSTDRAAIVWFRDDLRLADNPALHAAAASGRPVVCVHVLDESSDGLRPLGGAARWWLHGSLAALRDALAPHGGRLLHLRGAAADAIEALARDVRADAVFWNRRYDAAGRRIDTALKSALRARGVAARSFGASLLHEPWTVATSDGAPFRVFGAFWRAAQRQGDPDPPLPAPSRLDFLPLPDTILRRSASLDTLALEPRSPDWAGGLRIAWRRGEAAGLAALDAFVATALADYATRRDAPDAAGTSRLSPYLRFGNISPRQAWQAASETPPAPGRQKFRDELGWREFACHLLYHHPDLARTNMRTAFDAMPWRDDPAALHAWQRGRTGYPIVDAGMRALWATGWMHNRVRMIVASFLTKHLLIDWREGEAWFWDTLVDADPANNPMNWQWVAGSGSDAAPYFRIFNPTRQGETFDADGAYVRRWVPELARLPPALIHRPWAAPAAQRAGLAYPDPVIAHDAARRRALEAWDTIR
jgi:deoxyribodipyrimidine photo-lyase